MFCKVCKHDWKMPAGHCCRMRGIGLAAITRRDLAPSGCLLRLTAQVDKRAILAEYKTTDEIVPGVEVIRAQRLDIR
jgi:hypothetical protein